MPRISEFFGIIVLMYWFDQQRHKMPHFHARYRGNEAVFDLAGTCIEGHLGARAHRLIAEWAEERAAEIEEAWQAAAAGKEIPWVPPLQ